MNIKDKILGKRISGIFNALNILLGLFCIIYYSINANRVNEFNKAVDFYLVLAIMCCGIYVFADYVIADIFNLIAVVFITLSIGKMIVNSINTFADALNGISMFGSSGVIGYIIDSGGYGYHAGAGNRILFPEQREKECNQGGCF